MGIRASLNFFPQSDFHDIATKKLFTVINSLPTNNLSLFLSALYSWWEKWLPQLYDFALLLPVPPSCIISGFSYFTHLSVCRLSACCHKNISHFTRPSLSLDSPHIVTFISRIHSCLSVSRLSVPRCVHTSHYTHQSLSLFCHPFLNWCLSGVPT